MTSPEQTANRRAAHLSPAERARLGKEARRIAPLDSHAELSPAVKRDPVTTMTADDAARVPELLPIRYGRMLVSPFTFYRGAASVMAADLAPTPVSGFRAQTCGDAHLSNFGFFASAERALVFDINDFDETLPGPWEWDVKRLATSIAVASRANGHNAKQSRRAVLSAAATYRTVLRDFAKQTNLQVWYAQLDVDHLLDRLSSTLSTEQMRNTRTMVDKARTRNSAQALAKLSAVVDGERRIVATPPVVVPVEDLMPDASANQLFDAMQELLEGYSRSLSPDRRLLLGQYRLVHMARKVVGVGSVGTRSWVLLMIGRDDADPLFLQAKEAGASVLEEYVGASEFEHHGERVVAGQRTMQASGDIFLGTRRVNGIDGKDRDFYVRQLRDWKGSVEVEGIRSSGLVTYASICGWTLARAHARSGDRVAIASYLGSSDRFENAVADFAEAYADLNDQDFRLLKQAVRDGLIKVQKGI
ncbi:DUF2252 domain-containing protein [Actinoplanes awajinensis]|uniref:DUF2252 domain-containing protein n=1 Tax=Actinoplanes awajinensis subsp. mycoplanecinus TaxID=135947 RepID=A0A0X3UPK2_9ACTN|nr:DUF2252 domain-containing protein [Actinoplanes awajinensis]KUL34508.1 hypothetical protein ADL15_15635 [Actinoplanes awajinensis subsp. mycoplanecinus]